MNLSAENVLLEEKRIFILIFISSEKLLSFLFSSFFPLSPSVSFNPFLKEKKWDTQKVSLLLEHSPIGTVQPFLLKLSIPSKLDREAFLFFGPLSFKINGNKSLVPSIFHTTSWLVAWFIFWRFCLESNREDISDFSPINVIKVFWACDQFFFFETSHKTCLIQFFLSIEGRRTKIKLILFFIWRRSRSCGKTSHKKENSKLKKNWLSSIS